MSIVQQISKLLISDSVLHIATKVNHVYGLGIFYYTKNDYSFLVNLRIILNIISNEIFRS